jgi:hypothetical protein
VSALPQSAPHSPNSNFFDNFNAIIENQRVLTPTEFRLAMILLKRGAHREEVSLSQKTWQEWTGMDVKSRDLAIRGLTKKGFHSEGRGDRARFRFDRGAWATTCRTVDKSFRPKVEQKRQPAKPGQMIHPECRECGCYMARQAEEGKLVSIESATPNWKPVSNIALDSPCETHNTEARGEPAALVKSTEVLSCPNMDQIEHGTRLNTPKCSTMISTTTNQTRKISADGAQRISDRATTTTPTAPTTTKTSTNTTTPETSTADSRATNKPKQTTPSTPTSNRKPVSNSDISSPQPKTSVSGILCEQFIGLFLAAGKPLNKGDMQRAKSRWCELSPEDQTAAFNTAHEKLIQTADPQFIPLPANFLSAKSWTRSAPPRTLPVEQIDKSKKNKRAEERDEMTRRAAERITSK